MARVGSEQARARGELDGRWRREESRGAGSESEEEVVEFVGEGVGEELERTLGSLSGLQVIVKSRAGGPGCRVRLIDEKTNRRRAPQKSNKGRRLPFSKPIDCALPAAVPQWSRRQVGQLIASAFLAGP